MSAVHLSGQKRDITATLKKCIRHRQAIEPVIGYLKNDGLLGRNYLKGELGDRMNVVLCGAGHNLRLVLARLRFFCLELPSRFGHGWRIPTLWLAESGDSVVASGCHAAKRSP